MTKRTLTIIITVMTILTLTACGNAAVATTPVQDQPQVEPKQEVVAEPTAEVVEEQPEVTEEVVPAVEEQEEKTPTYVTDTVCAELLLGETMRNKDFASRPSIQVIKWDCKTQEGTFLEAGNEYDIAKGDVIIIYEFHNDDMENSLMLPKTIGYFEGKSAKSLTKYQTETEYFEATNLPAEPFEFEWKPYNDTEKYDFSVTFNPVQ